MKTGDLRGFRVKEKGIGRGSIRSTILLLQLSSRSGQDATAQAAAGALVSATGELAVG